MRKFLFITLFFIQFLHSQNVENVEKLKFDYSKGHSSWSKNGIYSTSQVFEFIKTENGDYKISKSLKIKSIRKNKTKFINDTIAYKTNKYRLITNNEIKNLLIEINTNKENFTEYFLTTNFIKPTKKEIYKIAKRNDSKEIFMSYYNEKEVIDQTYSEIQNYKYLKDFLTTNKPDIDEYEMRVDVWNSLRITTFSKEFTKIYDLQFFKNCGQPISSNLIEIDKLGKIKIIRNSDRQIINLEVNQILQNILPQNKNLWRSLELRNIRDNYIEWFLKNKTNY